MTTKTERENVRYNADVEKATHLERVQETETDSLMNYQAMIHWVKSFGCCFPSAVSGGRKDAAKKQDILPACCGFANSARPRDRSRSVRKRQALRVVPFWLNQIYERVPKIKGPNADLKIS